MNSSGWIRMREMIFFEYRELDRGREDRTGEVGLAVHVKK